MGSRVHIKHNSEVGDPTSRRIFFFAAKLYLRMNALQLCVLLLIADVANVSAFAFTFAPNCARQGLLTTGPAPRSLFSSKHWRERGLLKMEAGALLTA